ncbi:Cytochrome b/b6 domain protein [Thalassoporum mexicanum PCC 7367]|uniref:cytochrome b N-terminal domain-containing protein n=1 Tax=Thalassoporum mexicanum TaxID=3457544 RepID=UPI00029FA95A|nr:cytochrome b N-terminal domain-containing protein [Pseudanabaena sp. PCC 7367]AFY68757.1 Cytochrome b/b6 domain protein [Pseudanabaena sp. PCC 7367]
MQKINLTPILSRLTTLLAVATLTIVAIAAGTGILLALYYEPTAGGAYNSIRNIVTHIPNGSLIFSLHGIAGNSLVVVALLQIVLMFLSRDQSSNWFTGWVSGIFLTLSAIALGWTAMVIDWSQVGYWRFKLELGTLAAVPLIGDRIVDFITGGGAINTITVQRLYVFHSYILAIAAVILAIVHLGSLLWHERSQSLTDDSADVEEPTNGDPLDTLTAC